MLILAKPYMDCYLRMPKPTLKTLLLLSVHFLPPQLLRKLLRDSIYYRVGKSVKAIGISSSLLPQRLVLNSHKESKSLLITAPSTLSTLVILFGACY